MTNDIVEMVWITDGLSSSQYLTTCRLASEKYDNLKPGDLVKMKMITPDNNFLGEEILTIGSIIKSDGHSVTEACWPSSHSMVANKEELESILEKMYGEGCLDKLFLGITFS